MRREGKTVSEARKINGFFRQFSFWDKKARCHFINANDLAAAFMALYPSRVSM